MKFGFFFLLFFFTSRVFLAYSIGLYMKCSRSVCTCNLYTLNSNVLCLNVTVSDDRVQISCKIVDFIL